MNWIALPQQRPRLKNFLICLLFLAVAAVPFAPLLVPLPTQAADGVAITGSFYAHFFQVPSSASVYGSDINVSIRNTGDQNNVGFNVITEALDVTNNSPVDGIDITLSPSPLGIVLAPGVSQQFQVTVEVGDLVTPGQYKLWITAEPYVATGGPIVVLPSVRMSADMEVVGESRQVLVETVGRSGEPIAVVIRLYRVHENRRYEIAYSDIGQLHAKVAPGSYLAVAESKEGGFLAEQAFEATAGDEEMKISLTVETIYFEGFAANPAYSTETGELGYVQIAYTINNVYQPIPSATVRLVVTFNGNALEGPRIIHTYEPLQVRREGQPYDYRPVDGWRKGTFGFGLQLYTGEELYASTREVTLDVGGGAAKGSWLWIIFVILGILGTAGLGFLIFFLLKKRKKGEKPEKAEKKERKKKEEKPAPKGAEPVRKPEPYRPPEPIRPVQPVRYEEPTVEPTAEPATLSSVSTLKARMASMGRDQDTGKPAEEEPDTEKKDEPVETGPLASQPDPLPPSPQIEPERPAVKKVEEKGHKPGIFSKVTATGKKEPPKPPVAQGPAPVKPGDEVTINWPPKTVEPPKPPSDVQINWPPKPVEPPKPSALEEAARQRVEAQQPVVAPEEAAPEEEAATEEPGEPQIPPSRSSFSEAARLRMEARLRASEAGKTGAGPGESQTGGDATGGSGKGDNRPPSP